MADNIVVGFQFSDEASSKKALQELNTILKIKEKESSLSSEQKLSLFNQMINENYFTTPVGVEYLRKLQKDLYEDQTIESSQINSIPVFVDEKDNKLHNRNENNNYQVNDKVKNNNINNTSTDHKKSSHNKDKHDNSKDSKSEKEKTILKKEGVQYRERFIKSLILNIIFILVITVMFIITNHAKKYDLNYYRESVENEYINWENDLKERESIINEKENPT